ncbi:SDR family NAD(P)-dependent oxidoreductase [Streptomyces sp. Ac-502]
MQPMLDDLRTVTQSLDFHPATLPLISTLTGKPATHHDLAHPDYWTDHARNTVRFHDALTALHEHGATAYLEIGPDTSLTTHTQHTHPDAVSIPSLRKNQPESQTLTTTLAHLHTTNTATPDWQHLYPNTTPHPDLPTYPFQNQHHWLTATETSGEATDFGLDSTDHPLLGADLELVDTREHLFTGKLSLRSHPWLAEHTVHGAAVLPGSAYVDLALCVGARTGHAVLDELTLEAPLVVPDRSPVHVQLLLSEADDAGHRRLTVHSRPGGQDAAGAAWVRHAVGSLRRSEPGEREVPVAGGSWPPAGAEQVPVEELYERLGARGQNYGPGFRGVTAVWRADDELFAEVRLPEAVRGEEARFAVHPALLDAALHPLGLRPATNAGTGDGAGDDSDSLRLPFAWSGVRLHATGATAVRLRVAPSSADSVALTLTDAKGAPVVSVESLVLRPFDPAQLRSSAVGHRDALFAVDWVPAVPGAAAAAPEHVVEFFDFGTEATGFVAAHRSAQDALGAVQRWLAEDRGDTARLVCVTREAVAARGKDGVAGLDASPVWGLVRSAQSEHPDRFVLLDLDADTETPSAELISAALTTGEPQLALRNGELLVPRLARTEPTIAEAPVLDPNGTVLITGGTGALGTLLARHLVTTHGTRHLLLASRRGPTADGAAQLTDELTTLGAHTTITACDVTNPDALTNLLSNIPTEHPLTAVIHTAGTTDDGTVASLSPESLDGVLRAKVDAAWHLHRLTQDEDLAAFVLYSSFAGVLGNAGQANYAAANTYLDALAAHRRALGLPGTSLAWGLWEEESDLTRVLAPAERARLGREGVMPIGSSEGLELFDAALALDMAVPVPVRLDPAALRRRATAGNLPPLYRGLVPAAGPAAASASAAPAASVDAGAELRQRLSGVDEGERHRLLVELVRGQVAGVLGHTSPAAVATERGLMDMGFDSLSAVELRNRLGTATGLRLSTTLVFDYPTPVAIAGHLVERLSAEMPRAELSSLEALEAAVEEIGADEERRSRLTVRLEALLNKLAGGSAGLTGSEGFPDGLEAAADEDLFEFIDSDLDLDLD